jgi:hypothetical protein
VGTAEAANAGEQPKDAIDQAARDPGQILRAALRTDVGAVFRNAVKRFVAVCPMTGS